MTPALFSPHLMSNVEGLLFWVTLAGQERAVQQVGCGCGRMPDDERIISMRSLAED
jgi:hypothetical protein